MSEIELKLELDVVVGKEAAAFGGLMLEALIRLLEPRRSVTAHQFAEIGRSATAECLAAAILIRHCGTERPSDEQIAEAIGASAARIVNECLGPPTDLN